MSTLRFRPVLLAHTALLALALAGEAVINVVHHSAVWELLWLVAVLATGEIVLVAGLARQRSREIEPTLEAVAHILDAQTEAIISQQREIALLRTALDNAPGLQAQTILSGQALPDLSTLVERLAQAEDSLPEMLPLTRAWIGKLRGLATQAQARLETLARRTVPDMSGIEPGAHRPNGHG